MAPPSGRQLRRQPMLVRCPLLGPRRRCQGRAGLALPRQPQGTGGTGADPVHGGELDHAIGSRCLAPPPYTDADLRISSAGAHAWIRRAATGNPNGASIQNWPGDGDGSEKVFVVDTAFGVVEGLRNGELDSIGRFDAGAR
ncbi:MAG: hypothetical protein U1F56_15055 [Rubrivivax sp.]